MGLGLIDDIDLSANPTDLRTIHIQKKQEDPFDKIFSRTMQIEGGATVDTGGPTNHGITQSTYSRYLVDNDLPYNNVNSISPEEVKTISKDEFYVKPGFNKLPEKAASAVFDFGFNAGTFTATKALQSVVGAKEDGILGPKTQKAVNQFIKNNGENTLIRNLINKQEDHYKDLIERHPARYKKFEKGWMNRIKTIKDSLDLSMINPFVVNEAGASELPKLGLEDDIGLGSNNKQKYDTQLTPGEEIEFQEWKKKNAPRDSGVDYDLRGAFKAGLRPAENGHWPDTFKKPNHPTFSNESIYAKDRPDLAGRWEGNDYIKPQPQMSRLGLENDIGLFDQPAIAPVASQSQKLGLINDLNLSEANAEHQNWIGEGLKTTGQQIFQEAFVKPGHDMNALFQGSMAELLKPVAGAYDYYADAISRSTGLGDTEKKRGLQVLQETYEKIAEEESDKGIVPDNAISKINKAIYQGLGAAALKIPVYMAAGAVLGPFAMGAVDFVEASPAGVNEATKAGAQGLAFQQYVKAISLLPRKIQLPTAFTTFAGTSLAAGSTPEDAIANGIVGVGLSLTGRAPSMDVFRSRYAKVDKMDFFRDQLRELDQKQGIEKFKAWRTDATETLNKYKDTDVLKTEIRAAMDKAMDKAGRKNVSDDEVSRAANDIRNVWAKQVSEANKRRNGGIKLQTPEELIGVGQEAMKAYSDPALKTEQVEIVKPSENLPREQGKGEGEDKKIRHYTLSENIETIIKEGFDTTKLPIHAVGGHEAGPKTAKKGKDVLYFTTDNDRWSKAVVFVGEGKGNISNKAYDYENQKWVEEKNAYKKIDLSPVEAGIKENAKILTVDNLQKFDEITKLYPFNSKTLAGYDGFNGIEVLIEHAKKEGYDILNVNNSGSWESLGKTTKHGEKDFYNQITGAGGKDDYFILNKEAINVLQPLVPQAAKKEIIVKERKKPVINIQKAKNQEDLLAEARKYKTAEEWVEAQFSKRPKYGVAHRPTYGGMPPAHNLLEGDAIPRDVYEHPEFSIASGRNFKTDKAAQESWVALQKIRNNPEAEIIVYRVGAKNELNTGDWITFSKEYAKGSAEGAEKLYSFEIKAKDAIFAGDDINEFGYYPKSQLTALWEQAQQPETSKVAGEAMVQENNPVIIKAKAMLDQGKIDQTQYDRIAEFEKDMKNEQSGRSDKKEKAVFKIKIGADWDVPMKQVKVNNENKWTGPSKKKIDDIRAVKTIKDTLTDVEESVEGDYLVIKGYPKKELSPAASKGLGSYGSKSGENLEEAEKVDKTTSGEPFKLSNEITSLIKKYAERFGENYTGKNAGLYFEATKNIFLKSKNDLSVAVHELTHYLDKKYGIGDKVTRKTGESKSGNPIYDPGTRKTRKALTDIYVKYYPKADKKHKLSLRVAEGMAMFFQRYVLYPKQTGEEFPQLLSDFIDPSGKYYDRNMINFINDARAVIGKYQRLDPLDKIGTRVLDAEVLFTEPYLNIQERAIHWNIDHIYPLEKLAKESGEHFTGKDPSLIARIYNYVPKIIQHNLSTESPITNIQKGIFLGKKALELKKETYLTVNNKMELVQKFDFNWATLIREVDNLEDFNNWLVARRTKFAYDELDTLKAKVVLAKAALAEDAKNAAENEANRKENAVAGEGYEISEVDLENLSPRLLPDAKAELENTIKEYARLADILAKDKIDRKIAAEAYEQHKDRFALNVKMFDQLVAADLELLHNPKVGLVSDKVFEEMNQHEGYATFKRDIFNEIVGNPSEDAVRPTNIKIGGKKVSSLIGRHGSAKDIISPIFSSMVNHQEIFKKAVKQMVWNAVVDISDKLPDTFQRVPLVRVRQPDGKIVYPQDRDPNIIMGFRNGKRVPIVSNKELKNLIEGILTPVNVGLTEKIFVYAAKVFTKGTTALYPQFAVTNLMIDQISATATSWTKFKPIYTPISELMKTLANSKGLESKFAYEYFLLGGEQQAFISLSDMTPKEAYDFMSTEKNALRKTAELVQEGLDILVLPVKTSEILNRMAEYIRARKEGFTQFAALELAGRVTVPFHHRGARADWTRFAVRSVPYFNAGLQVLAQFGRTGKNPRTRNQALFVVAMITGAMLSGLMAILKNGTEKQKKLLESIPPDELGRYVFFPHSNGEDLLKYRIPQEMSTIGTMLNMAILEIARDPAYTAFEYLRGATTWIPDQLNPTNPVRAIVSWFPQAIQPTLSVGLNTKFYPTPRPLEPDYMKYLPKPERSFEYTSNFAKYMGPKLGLSPIQFEALFEGYLGRATRLASGKEQQNPFIRKLYFTSSRQMVNFFQGRQQNDEKIKQLKDNPKLFDHQEARDIRKTEEKIKKTEDLLKQYRKSYEKDKKSYKTISLRDKILDEVDTLK